MRKIFCSAILFIGTTTPGHVEDIFIKISPENYFQICCLCGICLNCIGHLLEALDVQSLSLMERLLNALEKDLKNLKTSEEELQQAYQGINFMIHIAALIQKFCTDFGSTDRQFHPDKIQSTMYHTGDSKFDIKLLKNFVKLLKDKISKKQKPKTQETCKKTDLQTWLLKSAIAAQAFIGVNIPIETENNSIIHGFLALHTWIACVLLFVKAFNPNILCISDDDVARYVSNCATCFHNLSSKFPALTQELNELLGSQIILQTDVATSYLIQLRGQLSAKDKADNDISAMLVSWMQSGLE